jgi:hypothetical protein
MKPMSPDEIKHFLITYDPGTGKTDVRSFGTDYEAAQSAYSKAEHANGPGSRLDIVLLSADSLKTVELTHSSYFSDGTAHLEELLSA